MTSVMMQFQEMQVAFRDCKTSWSSLEKWWRLEHLVIALQSPAGKHNCWSAYQNYPLPWSWHCQHYFLYHFIINLITNSFFQYRNILVLFDKARWAPSGFRELSQWLLSRNKEKKWYSEVEYMSWYSVCCHLLMDMYNVVVSAASSLKTENSAKKI